MRPTSCKTGFQWKIQWTVFLLLLCPQSGGHMHPFTSKTDASSVPSRITASASTIRLVFPGMQLMWRSIQTPSAEEKQRVTACDHQHHENEDKGHLIVVSMLTTSPATRVYNLCTGVHLLITHAEKETSSVDSDSYTSPSNWLGYKINYESCLHERLQGTSCQFGFDDDENWDPASHGDVRIIRTKGRTVHRNVRLF